MKNLILLSLTFFISTSISFSQKKTELTHKQEVEKLIQDYTDYLNNKSETTNNFLVSKKVWITKPYKDDTRQAYYTIPELKNTYNTKFNNSHEIVFNLRKAKISEIAIDKELNTYYCTVALPQQIRILDIKKTYRDTTIIDSVLVDSVYEISTKTDSIIQFDTTRSAENNVLNLYISLSQKYSKYTNYKIEALSFGKRKFRHQPTQGLTKYWTSLSPEWQKLISERLRFPDVPNDYYLKRITSITTLDLSTSEITDFSPLLKFTGLTRLVINDKPLDTLSYIQNCVKMKELNISNCGLKSLHGLEKMTKLQALKASKNEIDSLYPLKDCLELTELNLNENKVIDLTPLKNMRIMQRLHLDLNLIESLEPLRKMVILSELFIKKNKEIESLEPIRNCRTLYKLDCYSTKITSLDPIKNHIRLIHLDCGYTKINTLNPIRGLTGLRHLNFSGNVVSDFSILNRLDNLRYLNCSSTNISDIGSISRMAYLKELYAPHTDFTKSDIQRFKKNHPKVAITYW